MGFGVLCDFPAGSRLLGGESHVFDGDVHGQVLAPLEKGVAHLAPEVTDVRVGRLDVLQQEALERQLFAAFRTRMPLVHDLVRRSQVDLQLVAVGEGGVGAMRTLVVLDLFVHRVDVVVQVGLVGVTVPAFVANELLPLLLRQMRLLVSEQMFLVSRDVVTLIAFKLFDAQMRAFNMISKFLAVLQDGGAQVTLLFEFSLVLVLDVMDEDGKEERPRRATVDLAIERAHLPPHAVVNLEPVLENAAQRLVRKVTHVALVLLPLVLLQAMFAEIPNTFDDLVAKETLVDGDVGVVRVLSDLGVHACQRLRFLGVLVNEDFSGRHPPLDGLVSV